MKCWESVETRFPQRKHVRGVNINSKLGKNIPESVSGGFSLCTLTTGVELHDRLEWFPGAFRPPSSCPGIDFKGFQIDFDRF